MSDGNQPLSPSNEGFDNEFRGEPSNNFQQAAQIPGALHLAAKAGRADEVNFLLSQKADLNARDADGLTPLQVAEANGKNNVVKLLGGPSNKAPGFDNSPVKQKPTSPSHGEAAGAVAAAPDGVDEEWERYTQEAIAAGNNAKGSPKSASSPALGSYADLKAKTAFAGATTDGVLKSTTYMTKVSQYRTSPKYTLAARGQNMFIRSSSTPAPGTYNLPPDEKNKYKKPPAFSFGGNSRFGLGESPTKKMPGPGAYNPTDPNLLVDTKVGFGTSTRGRGALMAQANPGPGAYEYRSCVGSGKMFTAGGRHPTSYMRARSLPGPGAYNPMSHTVYQTSPKCGFGTSTRDDVGAKQRSLVAPGPGTYEMQNFKSTGSDAPKYSATSRRRLHDLNSYISPGPGAYNAHVTSFGY